MVLGLEDGQRQRWLGKVGSFALLNHNDSLEIRCGEDSMVVSICELQQRRNLNVLGFCSFHGTFAAIFPGAILSATNNSMAGGKLQLRDKKRFEQPQLASSQAIGVIGFPFEFPFEVIGKRWHRVLSSCMSQKFSLELVHGLSIHISCSVGVDPTFVLQQGGNTRYAGTFCDKNGFIHY